jgi:hypothetical protein
MVGAAPVLVVLATAVMAASDRPYVVLPQALAATTVASVFLDSLLLTATEIVYGFMGD